MAHVAKWKLDKVEEMSQAIASRSVVGVVNIHGIPAKQISKMRSRLRGNVQLVVSKLTLLQRAIDKAADQRPGLIDLKDEVVGQVGLVLTDENPFKLFRLMEATKTPAPAKGGELAPSDIVVKQGDTTFRPGPIVREFQKVGIPAAIERGMVVVKKTAVLVKEGETIPKDLASVLPRLDIYPIELGLNLTAAFEDGTVYHPDVLDVDVGDILGQLSSGVAAAFNLAVNAGYMNSVTVRPLLAKGHSHAFNLAVQAGIVTPETAAPILARAQAQAMALASHIPDALDEDLQAALAGAAATAPAPDAPAEGEAPGEGDREGDKEEDEEEGKVSEEDAASGLSSLFG